MCSSIAPSSSLPADCNNLRSREASAATRERQATRNWIDVQIRLRRAEVRSTIPATRDRGRDMIRIYRAAAVATAILQVIETSQRAFVRGNHSEVSALRDVIAATLREGFDDVARTTLSEICPQN